MTNKQWVVLGVGAAVGIVVYKKRHAIAGFAKKTWNTVKKDYIEMQNLKKEDEKPLDVKIEPSVSPVESVPAENTNNDETPANVAAAK